MNSDLRADALERLIHDVHSKCASLRKGVALLRVASDSEGQELLRLMDNDAQKLAQQIAAYRERTVRG